MKSSQMPRIFQECAIFVCTGDSQLSVLEDMERWIDAPVVSSGTWKIGDYPTREAAIYASDELKERFTRACRVMKLTPASQIAGIIERDVLKQFANPSNRRHYTPEVLEILKARGHVL